MSLDTPSTISGMPQITSAFAGWTQTVSLSLVTQTIVAGLVTETLTAISFPGTIQPLSPKNLMLKPEGQRAWTWLQIHCFSGPYDLNTGDQIVYRGEKFKIMARLDYSLNGFMEYHLVKDYQP